jgi:hypothetical protein
MRYNTRSIAWHGQDYHFEKLERGTSSGHQTAEWAVWRRGEFIGTMPSETEESTKEFELRCTRWLRELLAPGAST